MTRGGRWLGPRPLATTLDSRSIGEAPKRKPPGKAHQVEPRRPPLPMPTELPQLVAGRLVKRHASRLTHQV